MRRWCCGWLLLLALPLLACPAEQINFFISNDFVFQHNQLADRLNQFSDALSFFGKYRDWSMGFTLRGLNFYRQAPNQTLDKVKFELHRKFLQYAAGPWRATLGDFNALLGRGLVLAVLPNDPVFRDRSVSGIDLAYGGSAFNLRGLAGTVHDELNQQQWLVAAGEISWAYWKSNRLGAQLSFIDDRVASGAWGDQTERLVASLCAAGDGILRSFSYYLEFAGLWRPGDSPAYGQANGQAQGPAPGQGLFANLTWRRSRLTVMLEYKRYRDFDNQLNNPPVADREDEANDLDDAAGGRLYLQYSFFDPDLVLFLNFGRYRESGQEGNHFYGGLYLEDLWQRLDVSASYGVRDLAYPVRKSALQLVYELSPVWSLEFSLKDKRYRDRLDFRFVETDLLLQLSRAPGLSGFVVYQYSAGLILNRHHFFNGGIRLTLRSGTSLELLVGAVRGGQVCAGGQCFVTPPFQGARLSLLTVFR